MTDSGRDPIPLTVIGGYLGAGKTTLVNRILRDPGGRRLGVIVNDVGAVDIDAALIEAVDGDTVTLSNGCICCSLADGFAAALAELRNPARAIDHVVVEVSGVGDPRNVAQWGRTPGFALDAVVVLADVETVRARSLDRYVGETVVAQLAGADLVLFTHLDLVADPDTTAAEVQAWLADITAAPVLIDPAVALDLMTDPAAAPQAASPNGDAPERDGGHSPAHLDHVVEVIDTIDGRTRQDWAQWLDAAPASVVRVKGFAQITAAADADATELVSVQLAGRRTEVLRWKGRPDVPRSLVVIATHETPDIRHWIALVR